MVSILESDRNSYHKLVDIIELLNNCEVDMRELVSLK
jgi:hypothetical protein